MEANVINIVLGFIEGFALIISPCILPILPIFPTANNPEGGFWNGLLWGGVIAIIWTPCAGPILAAIIVQTALQKTTITSFLTLIAFALGAAIPMFIISLYGKKIMNTFSFFKTRATLFRKFLGGLIIALFRKHRKLIWVMKKQIPILAQI